MKIALVTDTYFPRVNGVAASIRTFAAEFGKLGHEVHIFAPEYPQKFDDGGLVVHRFPSSYLFLSPEDRLPRPKKAPDLIRRLVSERFDVVHTQTPFTIGQAAVSWARDSGALLVHTYHTLFSSYIEHYFPWFPRQFSQKLTGCYSRRYCDRCDLVIAPSNSMASVLEAYRIKTPIEVIPTGINLDLFTGKDPNRFRREIGVEGDDRLLLFMGRVAGEKNIDFLLRVVRMLQSRSSKIKLVIAGEGPAKPRLERLAIKLGLGSTVIFLGYLTKTDWRDCYAAADLFVFGSITETQGLVVTEAMAAGTPVVAVGRMGVKDVMASGRGGVLTNFDEREFAAAVWRMLSDRNFYLQKKSETQAEANRWSSHEMAKQMLRAYSTLAANRCTTNPTTGGHT